MRRWGNSTTLMLRPSLVCPLESSLIALVKLPDEGRVHAGFMVLSVVDLYGSPHVGVRMVGSTEVALAVAVEGTSFSGTA